MSMAESIKSKIEAALAPQVLEITNDSQKHAGHAGHDGSGESHFSVRVVSDAFVGLSRVNRQRAVYALLTEEFAGTLHALALVTQTPEEAAKL